LTFVGFGSEPRSRTGLGTGAKPLLEHSPSFFIYTCHTYPLHRETLPRLLLGYPRRKRVLLYPPSTIFRHSLAFSCPIRSPFPDSQARRPSLAHRNFHRRRDTGLIISRVVRVHQGLCLYPRRSAQHSYSWRPQTPRFPRIYKGVSGQSTHLPQYLPVGAGNRAIILPI